MEHSIDTVIGLLQQINGAYTEMLALSEEKHNCIIKADAPGVTQVVGEEWKLLQRISELEESRMAMVKKMKDEWGIADDPTLAEMGQRLGANQKKKMEKAGFELKNTMAAQKKLNDENMALLKLHFEYMNFMMSNFLQDYGSGNIYGQTGTVQEACANRTGIIDSHV